MKYKHLLFLIASYILAFSVNLMPSIMHPDLKVDGFNLLVTLLFMFLLLLYSRRGSKKLKVFAVLGVISGILVFFITTFEHAMFDNIILDSIASLQYPFYLIFITPVFGGNLLFAQSYGSYSLLISLFYGIILGLTIYFKKKDEISV
ncbi:hypothetical protein QNH47_09825 [Virgibacillus halodenitrificans]|uniref:hypothetical protein n=1 Tax=Virgibacillus halodenitrificans TaxID=1482 RepID=UPI0024C080ED|nr:hypothetical protein [Virgibacillus halodenitrificans]WHX24497.1 hypothetical protein QNH47_09825 [Virgibacillus halodenitrificans]